MRLRCSEQRKPFAPPIGFLQEAARAAAELHNRLVLGRPLVVRPVNSQSDESGAPVTRTGGMGGRGGAQPLMTCVSEFVVGFSFYSARSILHNFYSTARENRSFFARSV